jgi:hypothetical protein
VFPDGGVVFLELKATGSKPTPLQVRELERLKVQGALAVWHDSFEECKDLVDIMLGHPRKVGANFI